MRLLPHREILKVVYSASGILQIAAILCAFEKPAHAYVDPGSSYLLLQIAGSMLAGAAFFVRHRLKRILGLAADSDASSARSSSGPREEK